MVRHRAKTYKTKFGRDCWKINGMGEASEGDEFIYAGKVYEITEIIYSPQDKYPYSVVHGEVLRAVNAEDLPPEPDILVSLGEELGNDLAYLRQQIRLIRDWRRLENLDSYHKEDFKTPLPVRLEKQISQTRRDLEGFDELPGPIRSRLWEDFYEACAVQQEELPF